MSNDYTPQDPRVKYAQKIVAINNAADALEVQKLAARFLLEISRELAALNETLKGKAQ